MHNKTVQVKLVNHCTGTDIGIWLNHFFREILLRCSENLISSLAVYRNFTINLLVFSMYTTELGFATIHTNSSLTVADHELKHLTKLRTHKNTFIALQKIDNVLVVHSNITDVVVINGFLMSSIFLECGRTFILVRGRIRQNIPKMQQRVEHLMKCKRGHGRPAVVFVADSGAIITEIESIRQNHYHNSRLNIRTATVKLSQLTNPSCDQKVNLYYCMIDSSEHSCGVPIALLDCGFHTATDTMPTRVDICGGFILDNLICFGNRSRMIRERCWADSLLISPKLMAATVPGLAVMNPDDAKEYLKALPKETLRELIDMPLENTKIFSEKDDQMSPIPPSLS